MEAEGRSEDEAYPEEYVAMSKFTGSGSEQVREPHR